MRHQNATAPDNRTIELLRHLQPYPERPLTKGAFPMHRQPYPEHPLTKVDDAGSSVQNCPASAADFIGELPTSDTLPDWHPCWNEDSASYASYPGTSSDCHPAWYEDSVSEYRGAYPGGGCTLNKYDYSGSQALADSRYLLECSAVMSASRNAEEECSRSNFNAFSKNQLVHGIGPASSGDQASSSEASRTVCHEAPRSVESLLENSMSEFVRQGVMESIREAAHVQQAWRPERFRFVRTLEQAARNQGVVELVELMDGGGFVAVKRMPVSWTGRGPCEFQRDHKGETENPWTDVGVVMYLNKIFYPYVCKLHGTFYDSSETRIAYSFATHGDLFSWVSSSSFPEQGVERERLLRPIVREILHAVSTLHALTIAHCDISLENILLTSDPVDGALKIKLIDFGMAAVGKDVLVGERGKAIYHAPEMHLGGLCSPFPYDVFALGLVIFLVATTEYPWVSTRPPGCKKFKYALKYGFLGLLEKLKVRSSKTPLIEVVSHSLTDLLEMLLAFDPARRCTLRSMPEAEWLNG